VGCRYDSSLGMLTKKFLNLINKADDGVLDLNHAADMLQVRESPHNLFSVLIRPWPPLCTYCASQAVLDGQAIAQVQLCFVLPAQQ
jgi:hypothetical protein